MPDSVCRDLLLTERSRRGRRLLAYAAAGLACLSLLGSARADEAPNRPMSIQVPQGLAGGPEKWTSPEGLSSTLQVMLLLTVISLAPAVLLMTTCFVRIIVVLSLLRQAVGTQQLPPSQVITSLALFMTLLIMSPVWKQVYDEAIVPYTHHQINLEQAWTAGVEPIRRFMSMQIERDQQPRRRSPVPRLPARPSHAHRVRGRSLAGLAAGLHAQRTEDGVPDRLPDLLALPDPRHGGRQRHGVDGHVDAAAGAGVAALQDPAVRAGRRLAPGRANADGEFSTVYMTPAGNRNVCQSHGNADVMNPQAAIDLAREAIWTSLLIGSPVLLAGLAVGLVIGLLQALTQIQEQTVAFVPKIVAMALVFGLTLPWLIAQMLQYSTNLISGIPGRL